MKLQESGNYFYLKDNDYIYRVYDGEEFYVDSSCKVGDNEQAVRRTMAKPYFYEVAPVLVKVTKEEKGVVYFNFYGVMFCTTRSALKARRRYEL